MPAIAEMLPALQGHGAGSSHDSFFLAAAGLTRLDQTCL
jgi:hypothetical protein